MDARNICTLSLLITPYLIIITYLYGTRSIITLYIIVLAWYSTHYHIISYSVDWYPTHYHIISYYIGVVLNSSYKHLNTMHVNVQKKSLQHNSCQRQSQMPSLNALQLNIDYLYIHHLIYFFSDLSPYINFPITTYQVP